MIKCIKIFFFKLQYRFCTFSFKPSFFHQFLAQAPRAWAINQKEKIIHILQHIPRKTLFSISQWRNVNILTVVGRKALALYCITNIM